MSYKTTKPQTSQRNSNRRETEILEMFVWMQQDESKQVIIVIRSDSCLLQACKRCTRVQALPTPNFYLITSSTRCITGLVWPWPECNIIHFITSDRLRIYIKICLGFTPLASFHTSFLFINHCSMEALQHKDVACI